MEVDCGVVCFSPLKKQCLGVNHHRLHCLSDGLNDGFDNSVLMVSMGEGMVRMLYRKL